MAGFPQPDMSADWKDWAKKLVEVLSTQPIVRPTQVPTFALATLPKATPAGMLIFLSDDFEGFVPCYSDGTDWRRVKDDEVVG